MTKFNSTASCPDFSALIDVFYTNGTPFYVPPVTPNPDVSGKGVLIGFTASAYLTLLLVLIHYVMGCVREQDLNIIDEKFLRIIRRLAHFAPSPDWKEPLGNAVLMFSDQQIVTGIALLASGFSQLPLGLDAYHWQIVVYLAWFSSFTHLTTLTVLRGYFQDHPATRLWRVSFMLVTVALLGIALLPTGNQFWRNAYGYGEFYDTSGVPALCFFQGRNFDTQIFGLFSSAQGPSMIVSILVLFFGYVTRMVKLWPEASGFTRFWLRTKPGDAIKRVVQASNHRSRRPKANIYWKLKRMVFEIVYIVILAHLVLWDSMLWEILWLCFALAWGTTHLFRGRISKEDTWSFGQFLPVVLLMLPILSIAEDCYESWRSKHIPISQSHGTVNRTNNDTINNHLQGPSTHANHVGAYQQQPQLIRIGTWPSGTSTGLSARPIKVPNHHAIARTGTSLSMEEREVETSQSQHEPTSGESVSPAGVADTRSSNADATSFHDLSLADNTGSISDSQEVFRLEWFSLLVVMLLLSICELIIFVLTIEANPKKLGGLDFDVLGLLLLAATAWSVIWFTVTVYTGFFVFLTEYHNAVGKFLDRFLFLPRHVQQKSLRVLTYSIGVLWVIGMIGFIFVLSFVLLL